jgi:hypothetical protein
MSRLVARLDPLAIARSLARTLDAHVKVPDLVLSNVRGKDQTELDVLHAQR